MTNNKRGAGILLHISSLASPFGVGDMGPEACAFADFLHRSNQKYWQLLPLNPTEQGQGHSPYSSISSRAGNTLLISPELMVKDNLLNAEEIKKYHLPQEGKTNFAEVERVKAEIFEQAWQNFKQGKGKKLEADFKQFCEKEAYWLDDFALYMLLKKQNESQPWFKWTEEYKLRNEVAVKKLVTENKDEVDKTKFLQFLFFKQWHELRKYCNSLNIKLFGDLPFYVSYDSVDVWSHKDLFSLDKKGNMIGVAGVPPDAFSEDGQLWGMPVFLWDVLKKQNYAWWIERFKKNLELFDILRLDHFRAFADYWEVAADEETAKKGTWKPGPRGDLFKAVNKALGEVPFIAEDLGEINDAVYELRDEFAFSGMKVLQFAFGEGMPQNPYIPHNYAENFVAYTGTHDNNTIRGWYRQEGSKNHHQIEQYVGRALTEDDIPVVFGRLAYASVANIAILPIQDVLGLDEIARMNTPASGENNWQWRLLPNQVTSDAETLLKEWTKLYNRV
ncbi:4-alpha-glucanotransferase [Segetibacter aerophilus]|uniref:4-alpha-glucanotransferase n=1 Tax=Segetibacter aerophilus TaxID=670293 RepID=A0A512BB30_9BACT|nr:4-alpha-glucanotransferase [Segetibacter aerophilus]GEO09173.1 4-alpha-glucanotransferase [Segetibacter aerophilus]